MTQPIGNKACVLVVDDEMSIRNIVATSLKREQYEVITASDGLEALSMVSKRRPDVIVCDVLMPRMNGYQFLNALHEDPATQHIPFLFLSAVSDVEPVSQALRSGADDFITKPFKLLDLQARITALLRRSKSKQSVYVSFDANVWTPIKLGKLALLLDLFESEKDSGRIDLKQDGEFGEIILKNGEIISAQMGQLIDDKAIQELIQWKKGKMLFTSALNAPPVDETSEIKKNDAQNESASSEKSKFRDLFGALQQNIKETKHILINLFPKKPFESIISEKEGITIVTCKGVRITRKDARNLEKSINSRITDERINFVLDIKEVEEIEVLGLGKLVGLQRQLQFVQGGIILVRPNQGIRRKLQNMRLDRLFDICQSVEEALHILRKS